MHPKMAEECTPAVTSRFIKGQQHSNALREGDYLKQHDFTTGYLQLWLIGHFPSYIKVELLPQVKTWGCLLAVFKEKLAEFTITPELAISFEPAPPHSCLSERDDVSQKVWPTSLLLNIKGLTPEIY